MIDYRGQALAKANPRESMNGVVGIDIAALRWLKSHPIVGDALLMKLYDVCQGPGKTFFSDLCLTSPDHRGATGPLLFRTGFALVYVDEEEIEVAGGVPGAAFPGHRHGRKPARGASALRGVVDGR